MAEPRIYTKNYVTADDLITVSHGDATKARLYDRDVESTFSTSGADDDTTAVTAEVSFYDGVLATDRTIDTLIILNHNLKDWKLEYWDGDSWESLYANATDTEADRVVTHTAVTTSKIKVTCNGAAQIEDAEKFIGELISCKLQLDIGCELVGYDPRYRQKIKQMQLGDGSLRQAIVRWAPNRSNKYEARATFRFVNEATMETLKAIKETNQDFLWYPESASRVREIYQVLWTNPWSAPYTIPDYKGGGYTIDMDLKEA